MLKYLWVLNLSGIAAALWMVFGVVFVARRLPGYSHLHNALSELGAKGRRTAKMHPFINNYPIGLLFALFGIALYLNYRENSLVKITGILIFVHGISHLVAGAFPCDEDMGRSKPSKTHIVHGLAGLVMQFSLLGASVMWALSTSAEPVWFRRLSLVCAAASILFLAFMIKAFAKNRYIGLYQRLSIGALIAWAAVFSAISYTSHA